MHLLSSSRMDNTFFPLILFSVILLIENANSQKVQNCPPLKKTLCKGSKIMCIEPPKIGSVCPNAYCKPKFTIIKKGKKKIKCPNKCQIDCNEDHIRCNGPNDSKVPGVIV